MLITEYMKKFIGISLFISACLLGSCSSYDDERIWQDLNDIEQTIGDYESLTRTLNEQMSSLSEVLGSSFITLISQDADGNYVISYSNSGGETHTVTIATQVPRERITPEFLCAFEALLDAVHARGVVHLDARGTGNVMIRPDGSPGLIDFQASLTTGYFSSILLTFFIIAFYGSASCKSSS